MCGWASKDAGNRLACDRLLLLVLVCGNAAHRCMAACAGAGWFEHPVFGLPGRGVTHIFLRVGAFFFLPVFLPPSPSWSDLGLPLDGDTTLRRATNVVCCMPLPIGFLPAELDLAFEGIDTVNRHGEEKPVHERGNSTVVSRVNVACHRPRASIACLQCRSGSVCVLWSLGTQCQQSHNRAPWPRALGGGGH